MRGRIRVELSDPAEARHLLEGLRGLRTDVVVSDRGCAVEVLTDPASSRLVLGVLDAIETWLVRRRIASATVQLDERTYTLTSPIVPA